MADRGTEVVATLLEEPRMAKNYTYCPKCLAKRLYQRAATGNKPWGYYCAAKGCRYVTAPDDRDAPAPQPTEKGLANEVEKCRERIEHWKQWRNEPSAKKKLGQWRRRLKRAIQVAAALSIKVPQPPPPPPPPPTEEEIRAAELKATKSRVLMPWFPQRGTLAWAPWGTSGWSAVEIVSVNRKWARCRRVNPKTQEKVSTGKVQVAFLVRRKADQEGKDKPCFEPLEVFPNLNDKPEPKVQTTGSELGPIVSGGGLKATARTPEEEAAALAKVQKLLDLFGDDATDDDW